MTATVHNTGLRNWGRSRTALLTTFRRSGLPVTTPVSVELRNGSAYFVTAADSGKAKRLARSEQVELTPCTATGRPIGNPVQGRAQPVHGGGRGATRRLLWTPTSPLLWTWLMYRARGHQMTLYQVDPVG